jgi:hypothetical protein
MDNGAASPLRNTWPDTPIETTQDYDRRGDDVSFNEIKRVEI